MREGGREGWRKGERVRGREGERQQEWVFVDLPIGLCKERALPPAVQRLLPVPVPSVSATHEHNKQHILDPSI